MAEGEGGRDGPLRIIGRRSGRFTGECGDGLAVAKGRRAFPHR